MFITFILAILKLLANKLSLKTDKMNTYREADLHRMITKNGNVEIDIVPHNGDEPTVKTFTNFDEALAEITGLEYENEIYF